MDRRHELLGSARMIAWRLFAVVMFVAFHHETWAAVVSLDPSFGGGKGWVNTHFKNASATAKSNGVVYDAIIQADGKVVLAGSVDGAECGDYFQCFVLVRYSLSGALDYGFGKKGKAVTITGKAFSGIRSVIQQADGKLVVAGYANSLNRDGFVVARYNIDGSLDSGFDGDGMLTTVIDGGGESCSVIQQADGKLVVAGLSGNSNENISLVRYKPDGSLDGAFGINGVVTLLRGDNPQNIGCNVIAQVDGKLVVANFDYGGTGQVIVRYNPDGSLDAGFDGDGIVSASMSIAAIIQQSDGKLVAAGYSWTGSSYDFSLVRYNSDGGQDAAFGAGAIVSTDIGGDEIAYSLIQQTDGKLVVAGKSSLGGLGDPVVVVLARYNLDGSLDEGFDGDGIYNGNLNDGRYYARSVVQQKDGKLIVAGTADSGESDFFVARFVDDFSGTFSSDKAGSVVAFAGDVNSDGYGDYVIGMPGYDVPAAPPFKAIQNAGSAKVISGKNGQELMSVNGDVANDAMGSAVAGNGDIDNDGYDDVVVGAPKSDNTILGLKDAGSEMILYGGPGLRSDTIRGAEAKALFGSAVALGDVNNDGHADIIVGAPMADDLANKLVDAGSVTVINGKTLSALPDVYYGKTAKAYAGASVEAGEVDAVPGADVIVGAPNDDDAANNLKDAGSVSVYAVSNAVTPVIKKYGAVAKALLGKSVATGNVDGVAGDEVVAGAPGDDNGLLKNTGSMTVFFADTTVPVTKYGAVAKAGLGNSLAVGDVDGDGKADIIAGASRDDVAATVTTKKISDAGSVTIWSGNGFVPIGSPLYGGKAKDYFGHAVSAGDINRDGKADLIIGIPGFDAAPIPPATKLIKDAGAVKVLSGAGL